MANTKTTGSGNYGAEPEDSTTNDPISNQNLPDPDTGIATSRSDPPFCAPYPDLTIAVAVGMLTSQEHTWDRVNRRMRTTTIGHRSARGRTAAAEFTGSVRNPTNADRRILFPRTVGGSVLDRKEAAHIVLVVNLTLGTRKVLSHICLQRLTYNEKGNMSRLLGIAATINMIVPTFRETILTTARRTDTVIIDVTDNKK